MLMSIDTIENGFQLEFRRKVVEPGIKDPIKFLQRWLYLSSQVPRLHGAALARIRIPDIQFLLTEIAYGECGFGDNTKIHCKLLAELMRKSPYATAITQAVSPELEQFLEDTVSELCQMSQDEAIGFIVGLEAPAYEILGLLKQGLVTAGIDEADVLASEYIVIHDAVEKEHQESGHAAMEMILSYGFDLYKIYQGGNTAVRFLIEMVGENMLEKQLSYC